MRGRTLGITFGAFVLALTGAAWQRQVQHFRLVLERAENVWSASCDSGCAWTRASLGGSSPRPVRLDFAGISGNAQGGSTERFAFVAEANATGWKLRSLRGTAWDSLTFACPRQGSCRAVITEVGVRAP